MPSVPPRNLRPCFEAQTRKPSARWFEAQTTKPSASSILHTRPPQLDACHLRPRPSGRQVFQSLRSTCTCAVLTRSTRSLLHVHLRLSMSPGVSHHGWSSDALVHQSKPHIHPSPLPVHHARTPHLTFSIAIDRLGMPNTYTLTSQAHIKNELNQENIMSVFRKPD